MDRTLLTPPMIETFRVCRRAYQMAFLKPEERSEPTSSICKRFLLKALAEINRGRISTVNQVQKFMGQHWPVDKIGPDEGVKAFLFVYKCLIHYVNAPYRPEGAQIVGVSLKVRARIPHDRVYLEDTFDLILWYPREKKLEFVDFHVNPLKPFNPAWPSASIQVRQFLAERLHCRWPFEQLVMTFARLGPGGITPASFTLDDSLYRLHWPELVKTVDEMKDPSDFAPHRNQLCARCEFLTKCTAMGQFAEDAAPMYRSA